MLKSPYAQPIAITSGEGNQNSLHICWMLHNACNHRCTYCHKANWGGSDRWLSLKGLESFLRQVRNHYKRDRIHVSFTGGEPTLWSEFAALCRTLKDDGCDLGMTSNGGHGMKVWEETRDYYNWLCLSYHPEFTKDEHFLNVIQMMAPYTRLAVRLMMHKEEKFWRRSIAFGEKVKTLSDETPIYVEYVPLLDDFSDHTRQRPAKYEAWQNDFFCSRPDFSYGGTSETIRRRLEGVRDVWDYQVQYADGRKDVCRPNELVSNNSVNFHNWECDVGLNLLFINSKGEVYRGNCGVGGMIGHIFDSEIVFPREPVICPKSFCPCGTDIQVPKRMSDGISSYS